MVLVAGEEELGKMTANPGSIIKMNKEELSLMLQKRWKYKQHSAEESAKSLLEMQPEIQSAFSDYLTTEVFPDQPKYFGLTPIILSRNYHLFPPAIFMLLDWIKKEPEPALQMLVEQYHKPLPEEFSAAELFEWIQEHQEK